jgi:hypothetical protein
MQHEQAPEQYVAQDYSYADCLMCADCLICAICDCLIYAIRDCLVYAICDCFMCAICARWFVNSCFPPPGSDAADAA